MKKKSEPFLKLYLNFPESPEFDAMQKLFHASGPLFLQAIWMTIRRGKIQESGGAATVSLAQLGRMAVAEPEIVVKMLNELKEIKPDQFSWQYTNERLGLIHIHYPGVVVAHQDLIDQILDGKRGGEASGKARKKRQRPLKEGSTTLEGGLKEGRTRVEQPTNQPTNQPPETREQNANSTAIPDDPLGVGMIWGYIEAHFGAASHWAEIDLRKVVRSCIAAHGTQKVQDALRDWDQHFDVRTHKLIAEHLDALCRGHAGHKKRKKAEAPGTQDFANLK